MSEQLIRFGGGLPDDQIDEEYGACGEGYPDQQDDYPDGGAQCRFWRTSDDSCPRSASACPAKPCRIVPASAQDIAAVMGDNVDSK